jgi:hypothetical protein
MCRCICIWSFTNFFSADFFPFFKLFFSKIFQIFENSWAMWFWDFMFSLCVGAYAWSLQKKFYGFFSIFQTFFLWNFPKFWKVLSAVVLKFYVLHMRWHICIWSFTNFFSVDFFHFSNISSLDFFQHFGRSQAIWFSCFPHALVHMHLKFYKLLFYTFFSFSNISSLDFSNILEGLKLCGFQVFHMH